jgi:Zn-dependent protease
MPRGFQIGRLFGTDIYASPSFILLMGLLLISNLGGDRLWAVATLLLALVISVLVHEFGHAFAVRRLLGSNGFILLWALGGIFVHEPTRVIGKRIKISLSGPGFGLVAGLLALLLYTTLEISSPVLGHFVAAMMWINLGITALNLLPILPLDGGQATLAALEWKLPQPRALRVVRRVSVVFAAGGIAAALSFGQPWLALLAGFLLFNNLFAVRQGV